VSYEGVPNLEAMEQAANYNRFLLELILSRVRPGAAVLDFGAGLGQFCLELARRGYAVSAVEADPALCAELARNGVRALPSLEAIAPRSIDLAFSFNVLEHLEDDQAVVCELARKLAPGGTLLLYVPAFELLFSAMDHAVGHLRRYRRERLVELVERAGLSVRTARYVDCLGFLAALTYKAFSRSDGQLSRSSVRSYDRLVFPLSRRLDPLFSRLAGKNLLLVADNESG
jgi:SAM-dependent methyltransferase